MMRVSGWASTPAVDLVGHIIMRGSLDESIRKAGITGPKGIKLLAYHNAGQVVGAITKLESKISGYWLEAEIDTDISYGRDVALAIKAAKGMNFSIGLFLIDADIDVVNGSEVLKVLKADLVEISIVSFPANPEAVMVSFQG